MNRWRTAAHLFAALAAYISLSAVVDASGPRSYLIAPVYHWWHPMVAVLVGSVVATHYCARRARW